MANKSFLDYAGLKRVLKTHKNRGMRYIFHGTLAEWEALTAAQKNKYEQAEIIDEEYTAYQNVITARNKAVSSWVADSTYPDFPLKAVISIPGVTADYSPDVRLSYNDAISGVFAPVADSGAGTVTIYANMNPGAITIPVIICTLMGV